MCRPKDKCSSSGNNVQRDIQAMTPGENNDAPGGLHRTVTLMKITNWSRYFEWLATICWIQLCDVNTDVMINFLS
jgi:hypothetical protein